MSAQLPLEPAGGGVEDFDEPGFAAGAEEGGAGLGGLRPFAAVEIFGYLERMGQLWMAG